MASLMILTPEGRRESRELEDGTYLAGRGDACHIRLASPEVSTRHALFTVAGESVTVEDLGSVNGIYCDGRKIGGRENIGGGQLVEIGPYVLRFEPAAGHVL